MAPRNRTRLPGILIAVVVAAGSVGCGGGGGGSSQAPIDVAITPATVTVQWGGTTQLTATVNNDGSNRGVSWAVSCSSIPCGTVSPTSTASGAPATYTVPVTLPASNLSVTLTATSVADSTKSASASITVQQIPGFNGVSEAHIDKVNGMTRLIINGKPAPPLMFMDQENFLDRVQYLAPQVQDAAARGIHLFQMSLHAWPWDNQGQAPLDFSYIDQVMDNLIKADPQAILLLRVDGAPGPGWKPPVAPTAADYTKSPNFQFAPPGNISLASDIFFNGFLTSVPHLFQHLENSSYAAHLLGYNILGPPGCGEWFPCEIVHGPDYSPVNTQKFQTWLQNKYGTDAALSAAWGMPVTIATAQVPPPQPGRFPIQTLVVVTPPPPIYAFYQLPQEQDWVDYSAFTSDLYSQRILDVANLFRTQTGGKRLIGFYNGYLLDLPTSYNGHLRFDRLLASPNIDFFCAAFSKFDYGTAAGVVGGAGGVDITIETVVAHGKLWFTEEDLSTYLSATSIFPPLDGSYPPTSDLTQTVDVLQRDLASALIHRAGTWWMDLSENGAFNDPAVWSPMSDYGVPLYTQLYANPQPYRPDVALIIDRTSIMFQKNDADVTNGQRGLLRIELARSGVAYGVYTLDDFLDGTEPSSPVYIFANTNYLTDDQITQIQSRLNAEGATAIWQYAPGFLGPNDADVTRVSKLTGIQVIQSDGLGWTDGGGLMAGYTWGYSTVNVLSPRLFVTDPSAEVLGHYRSDNQVSSARKKVGNFESVFIGEFGMSMTDLGWSPDALRAILQTTGVHIWSTAGDTISTDGNLLVIHAAAAGPDSISLPAGVSATPLGGGSASTGTLNLTFSRVGETLWFQLSQNAQGAKLPVRRRSK